MPFKQGKKKEKKEPEVKEPTPDPDTRQLYSEKLPTGIALRDCIDSLKTKYTLTRNDMLSYAEKAVIETEENNRKIARMKNKITEYKRQIERNKQIIHNADKFGVIKFGSEEMPRLDKEKAFRDRKKRDLLKYEYEKLQKQLMEKMEEYGQVENWNKPADYEELKEIKEKMQGKVTELKIKITTAENLNATYERILEGLRKEKSQAMKVLQDIGKATEKAQEELENYTTITQRAADLAENAKKEFFKTDAAAAAFRLSRDAELMDVQRQMMQPNETRELLNVLNEYTSVKLTQAYAKAEQVHERRTQCQTQVSSIEEVLNRIINMTNSTSVMQMLESFQRQDRMNVVMNDVLAQLQADCNKAEAELVELYKKQEDVCYTDPEMLEGATSKEQTTLKLVKDHAADVKNNRFPLTYTLARYQRLEYDAECGARALKTVLRKFGEESVETAEGETAEPTTVVELWRDCRDRLEKLVQAVMREKRNQPHVEIPNNFDEYYRQRDRVTGHHGWRPKRSAQGDDIALSKDLEHDFESSKVPTRLEMKSKSKRLMDMHRINYGRH